jgi:heavy metal sensor kinase
LTFKSVTLERVDKDLEKRVEMLSSLLTSNGINAVQRMAVLEAQTVGEEKVFFRLLFSTGVAFASSNMSSWQSIGINRQAILQMLTSKASVYETVQLRNQVYDVRIVYGLIGPNIILQMGWSLESQARFLSAFRRIFAMTMAVLLGVAVFVGWFMARRAVSGVETITRTARQISQDASLDKRVPEQQRGDEIDQLAATFNQMLDRLQAVVKEIKEMSDNIAHDLKSPITRIRGAAEIALTTAASEEDFRQVAAGTIEECDRLLDMINTMLVISEAEAGVNHSELTEVDLSQLVRDACELFEPMAEDKRIQVTCEVPDQHRHLVDRRMVQRMVANLIDNAIKYTLPGGQIEVRLDRNGENATVLKVTDNGIGIAPHDIAHIFERFYRCDPSRCQNAATPGVGLGLSLARTIARAHGGDIEVESHPEHGSVFTVTLPASTMAHPADI